MVNPTPSPTPSGAPHGGIPDPTPTVSGVETPRLAGSPSPQPLQSASAPDVTPMPQTVPARQGVASTTASLL